MTALASLLHPATGRVATRGIAVACPSAAWAKHAYACRPFAGMKTGNGRSRRTEDPIR